MSCSVTFHFGFFLSRFTRNIEFFHFWSIYNVICLRLQNTIQTVSGKEVFSVQYNVMRRMHVSHFHTKYGKLRKTHCWIFVLCLNSRKTQENLTLNKNPNVWTIKFNEINNKFICVTPKTIFFSLSNKYHIFIDFYLVYCWHIVTIKQSNNLIRPIQNMINSFML